MFLRLQTLHYYTAKVTSDDVKTFVSTAQHLTDLKAMRYFYLEKTGNLLTVFEESYQLS